MQSQERVSNQVVNLPPMGPQLSPEQISQKSLTHWIWTPFKNISNMMPWGLKSELGYRDQRWSEFKRCVPYPLGNLTSTAVDRAAMAEIHESGFTMAPTASISKELVKYAQEQAQELGESYADSDGLRVLTPLIGMEDRELVGQIVQVVQPFAYALHEMPYEFSEGAKQRIAQSNLSEKDKEKAAALAVVMHRGAEVAITNAEREYEALISSMSEAQVGKPGISNPNAFHRWICEQLNKPVPERIDRTAGGSSKAIDILAQRALREETTFELMTQQLEAERAARQKLEDRLAALEKPKAKSS